MTITQQKRPLKLLLFRPTLGQGGADRVTVTLLQSFDPQVFDASLVLVRREGAMLSILPPDVKVYDLKAKNLKNSWLPLLRVLRAERPDILFSTSSGGNIIAVLSHILARQKCRLILSERNVLLHGRVTVKKKIILFLKRLLYRRADHITSVSQGVKDDLIRRLQVADERISVVYNPVITENIPHQAVEPVEHPWFNENIPVILGVGRLVEEKDFSTLIKAFTVIRAERKARLFILGEGELRENLEQLIVSRGLQEDVQFGGFDPNPFKYMAKCTCFVLSSKFEGLPGVLIQAMYCGAPVISTDCPSGPSEIIESGVDGFLVSVGDVAAMADKLKYLLDHPEVRRQFSQQAQISTQKFKVETVLNYYTNALIEK